MSTGGSQFAGPAEANNARSASKGQSACGSSALRTLCKMVQDSFPTCELMATDMSSTEPKRRWFQFRLRTLLIGMALLALPGAYLGHEAKIVAARKAWLAAHFTGAFKGARPFNPDKAPSALRRFLGDEPYNRIDLFSTDEIPAAEKLFPEAQVGLSPAMTD